MNKEQIPTVSGAGAIRAISRAFRAASIAYFGKEPKRLSLAESALLVALRNRRKPAGSIATPKCTRGA